MLTRFIMALLAFGVPAWGEVRLGAYYFEGWTGKTDHVSKRLRTEFAGREPMWGWIGATPEIMRTQIDLAADHGVNFFAFDWYWPSGAEKRTPLNDGLELYLRSPNRGRLGFCLLVANHGGFEITPDNWDDVCAVWVELFAEKGHETVDGKPLLVFFSPRELFEAFGGVRNVQNAFGRLQQRAQAAGLKGVAIAGCCAPGPENGWIDLNDMKAAGYALVTGYNYHGYPMKGDDKRQAFATMIEGHEDLWNRFAAKNILPCVPCVTTGWDKRPWEPADKPPESVFYPDRSPTLVREFVRKAIRWMDANPRHTTKERLVLLYAWNEIAEGGFLVPTRGEADSYLRAMKEAVK